MLPAEVRLKDSNLLYQQASNSTLCCITNFYYREATTTSFKTKKNRWDVVHIHICRIFIAVAILEFAMFNIKFGLNLYTEHNLIRFVDP